MTTKAKADHIMAEIRTNYRRYLELEGVKIGSLENDPAIDRNGSPIDPGHELDTPEKIREANGELVGSVDSYPIWHSHIGFRNEDGVKITVQIQDDKVTDASLYILNEEGWNRNDLGDCYDRDALAWMLNEMGWNPARRPARGRRVGPASPQHAGTVRNPVPAGMAPRRRAGGKRRGVPVSSKNGESRAEGDRKWK